MIVAVVPGAVLVVVGAAAVGLDSEFDALAGRPALAAWFKSLSRKKMFRDPLTPWS